MNADEEQRAALWIRQQNTRAVNRTVLLQTLTPPAGPTMNTFANWQPVLARDRINGIASDDGYIEMLDAITVNND